MRLEIVGTTDLRIIICVGSYGEEYPVVSRAGGVQSQLQAAVAAMKESEKAPSSNICLYKK